MDKAGHHICLHCKEMFIPSPYAPHARYCSRTVCRKASKQDSQLRWRNKPENRNYFCGSAHVKRVQAWRKAHPGYWRRGKGRKGGGPLQDIVALQDLVPRYRGTAIKNEKIPHNGFDVFQPRGQKSEVGGQSEIF